MALATLNYSRLCHNYSIYSRINREVNKDVNKKEVYDVLIFQYFKVRHVSSAMTSRAQVF
jgi:transcription initiation factor TFIID subunit TAF12